MKAAVKRENMEAQQVRGVLSSAGTMIKTLNSADLHSDGVIERETASKNSVNDSFSRKSRT
eukprot:CAMPEP_0185592520 /NCGR_PEP_ID=MMETSP0434-20130131/68192_1 /TAXON_ID=626734 ORGANISM="Favella taraikaensis, Strain Fe Narragansett Bay" /NCGR_SAMPLE_ID=MMETSP0434 /ASSEMBLY_ACC=CAM_ASM_000379 /LENGTH=60 /DNA_ID=CAMNT_0028218371 /DNA_START=416 /DNA_END=598 /DNA_ORIENTATION=-